MLLAHCGRFTASTLPRYIACVPALLLLVRCYFDPFRSGLELSPGWHSCFGGSGEVQPAGSISPDTANGGVESRLERRPQVSTRWFGHDWSRPAIYLDQW